MAYKTIGKIAGLNVVIDPDYKSQKITVDLTNVTVREALDMIRLQSKTFWRPVLPNTIFVAADSPTKRKELEQNVMKTFYLRNIEAPTELQEAAIRPDRGQQVWTPAQQYSAIEMLTDGHGVTSERAPKARLSSCKYRFCRTTVLS